jgi:DeoR family transcriptional regulator, aga operon transcriptional repressor
MNKEDRHKTILELLEAQGSVEVSQLSQLFTVSEMSIRSDLNHLAAMGKLNRIYGGANKGALVNMELPLVEKQTRNREKKAAIGKLAASLVENGDSIMIEAGTTTEQVARCLLDRKELTVITNGINIVNTLIINTQIRLYTIGGEVVPKSYSIVGSNAERALEEYYAKVCIVGTDALDIHRGLTDNSYEAANIAKMLMKRSRKKILVCDSSKIGRIALIPVCDLDAIDYIVTDNDVPRDFVEKVGSLGVQVLAAT